jgi:hypothetical protein
MTPFRNAMNVTDLPEAPPRLGHFLHKHQGVPRNLRSLPMQQMMGPPHANSTSTLVKGIDNAIATAPDFVKEQVKKIEKSPTPAIVVIVITIFVVVLIVLMVRWCARRRRQMALRKQNTMDSADWTEMESYGIQNGGRVNDCAWNKPKKNGKWWSLK